jgi:hypothetical protein
LIFSGTGTSGADPEYSSLHSSMSFFRPLSLPSRPRS